MRTKEIAIICITIIIAASIICITAIVLHENNNNIKSDNTKDKIENMTSNNQNANSKDNQIITQEDDEWFGNYRDPRTNIMPHEHAEWESSIIDKAESEGFEVTGCNTDGIKNGYDVYTKNGKFAGHIN